MKMEKNYIKFTSSHGGKSLLPFHELDALSMALEGQIETAKPVKVASCIKVLLAGVVVSYIKILQLYSG